LAPIGVGNEELQVRGVPGRFRLLARTPWLSVVQEADASVVVHRVETALVVRTLEVARTRPADDEHWGKHTWLPTMHSLGRFLG
jgi:hypothetical protein